MTASPIVTAEHICGWSTPSGKPIRPSECAACCAEASSIVTDHEWEPSVEGTSACEFCGRRPGDHLVELVERNR